MKIVSLTPGTGNFHCGSCLRDEAVTAARRKLGHDVMLVPLYLPLVTEGVAKDIGKVFVGGINIYLQSKVGLFKHTPRFVDRIFDSKPMLKMAADRAGMTDAHELGSLTVSMLRGEHGVQNKEPRPPDRLSHHARTGRRGHSLERAPVRDGRADQACAERADHLHPAGRGHVP